MGMPATAKCPDVAISFYPFVRVDAQQSLFSDRKSVVEGKSVDLGGRRLIKKKK